MHITRRDVIELAEAIVDKPFDYSKVPASILGIDKFRGSLERMYKHIIKNQTMRCMHNRFEYDDTNNRRTNSIFGIFYDRDCTCKDIYCKTSIKDDLGTKAERFYTSLPVFAVESNAHKETINKLGITLENIDVQSIQIKMQRLYNEICDSMGIHRIKVTI